MADLVIVEASGKIDVLKNKLKSIGVRADVMATLGHIADNPVSLNEIALDHALRETQYCIKSNREALLEKILRAATKADNIYLAMDDDQEGDVIAYDLSQQLIGCGANVLRVRLRAMSETELRSAFAQASSRDMKVRAHNGMCRRILDRAIGSAFTSVTGNTAIPVGRVQSSLLATIDKHPPQIGRFVLQVPLGGGVFRAEVPVFDAREVDELTRLQAMLDAAKDATKVRGAKVLSVEDITRPVGVPWGYEEVVAETSLRMKISVEQAAEAFQEAYERGKVSYPRVRKNGYTPDAVEVAAALARQNRSQFDGGLLPLRSHTFGGSLPHESPRPLDDEMLLGRPLAVMDLPEVVAVLVARNMIECGQQVAVKKARLAIETRELDFCYTGRLPVKNWSHRETPAGYQPFSPDCAMLRYMSEHNLGRPSTVVAHVAKFVKRGLIKSDGSSMRLSDKGQQWLRAARSVGFGPETSARMEEALSAVLPEPHQAAQAILREHKMLDGVMEKVFSEKPNKIPENFQELSF